MKLQSKLLVKVYMLCALGLSLILSVILIFGTQSRNEKFLFFIFLGSMSLLCIVSMIMEIRHYVIFGAQNVVIMNRIKSHEILLTDLRKIEIYEPVWETSRYMSVYKNKIVFILDDNKIKFEYYTSRKTLLRNEIRNSLGDKYMGMLISKKSDEYDKTIYEFVCSLVLSLISIVGIVLFSIDYSWHLYLSLAVFFVGGYMSYWYYSKMKRRK